MINHEITQKLISYQVPHLIETITILDKIHICLDTSDTGTGKTYTSMAIAKHYNSKPFIVSPKTIMSTWEYVANYFGIQPLAIVNYETLVLGKYYDAKGRRVVCPYLKKINGEYIWNLPNNTIIIFDEAHHCCSQGTLVNRLLHGLIDVYGKDRKLLLLSATIADTVDKFKIFGLLIKWYNCYAKAPDWVTNAKFNPNYAIKLIHQKLYPNYATRMAISNLIDYPKKQITVDLYTVDNPKKINKKYDKLIDAKKDLGFGLGLLIGKIVKLRQKIESCKIDLFVDLANEYLQNGFSVVIFVNFIKTLEMIAKKLNTTCVICGKQTLNTRHQNIQKFMNNIEKVIICNIQAGSESISLHDKVGNFPRVALISPTWSATKFIQATGRIHRADSKSIALNKIVLCAKTIEEKIFIKLKAKINNINELNEEDLEEF
jgi:superfamily II DNA or RNA helicase